MSIITVDTILKHINNKTFKSFINSPQSINHIISNQNNFNSLVRQAIQQSSKGLKTYRYLVTFTLRDASSVAEVVGNYIVKQFKRKPLRVVDAYIVKELTKKGVPHWHVAVETLKPLKKDRFNYYIKKYGNIDISRTKAQNLEEAKNYISKSNEPTKIDLDNALGTDLTPNAQKAQNHLD